MANLLQKMISYQTFYVTKSGVMTLTLFDKHLVRQNHMVQNRQNFELFCKKWLTFFETVLLLFFWMTFLWHKQLFNSKNHDSQTLATRVNVASNMADLISLNENFNCGLKTDFDMRHKTIFSRFKKKKYTIMQTPIYF